MADGPASGSVPMRVGLFVTCLADLMRPEVAFSALDLLRAAGCTVAVPRAQTCCGQPAWNSGDRAAAAALARSVIETFEEFDAVVVPSSSCAGMIKHHYPEVFADDPAMLRRAEALAARTHELTGFLHDVLAWRPSDRSYNKTIVIHDSCTARREMGSVDQPRALLSAVTGLRLQELSEPEECCGFGGTFCVKYPDISEKMVSAKTADIVASGAEEVVALDLGCLLNIAGRLHREERRVSVRHVAEILAGRTDTPGIGEGS